MQVRVQSVSPCFNGTTGIHIYLLVAHKIDIIDLIVTRGLDLAQLVDITSRTGGRRSGTGIRQMGMLFASSRAGLLSLPRRSRPRRARILVIQLQRGMRIRFGAPTDGLFSLGGISCRLLPYCLSASRSDSRGASLKRSDHLQSWRTAEARRRTHRGFRCSGGAHYGAGSIVKRREASRDNPALRGLT